MAQQRSDYCSLPMTDEEYKTWRRLYDIAVANGDIDQEVFRVFIQETYDRLVAQSIARLKDALEVGIKKDANR